MEYFFVLIWFFPTVITFLGVVGIAAPKKTPIDYWGWRGTCYVLSLWIWFFASFQGMVAVRAQESDTLILSPDNHGVQRAQVVMESYAFSPSKIMVKVNVPVELTLVNESFLVPHNFVLDIPEDGIHLEQNVAAGERKRVTFTVLTPGMYEFFCDKQLLFFPSHREEGMVGTLEVR